jgi:hypothetical protein
MPTHIHFPNVEPHLITHRACIWFPAVADAKPIGCIVPFELLLGPTTDDPETALQVFHAHRADLHQRASVLIHEGRVDKDGELVITALA